MWLSEKKAKLLSYRSIWGSDIASVEYGSVTRKRQKILQARFPEIVQMWKSKLREYFGNDFLSDGIGYRCARNIEECYTGDHYSWDMMVSSDYGDVCIAVSTRALQNLKFKMGHGDKLQFLPETHSEPNHLYNTNVEKPWNWQPDWVITKWMEGLDNDEEWGKASPREKELIEKFRKGVWPITHAQPHEPDYEYQPEEFKEFHLKKQELEVAWAKITTDSKMEYCELLLAAFKAAPWWLYKKEMPKYFENHGGLLNEFTVNPTNRSEMIKKCILAKRVGDRIVYVLDPNIQPGSEEAGVHYDTHAKR